MNKKFRPLTRIENFFTYPQNRDIANASGLIGCLTIDFPADHKGLWRKWDNLGTSTNTLNFNINLDDVFYYLFRERDLFSNLYKLREFCNKNSSFAFQDGSKHYGFRFDTDEYSYFIRFSLEDCQGYMYCYSKHYLDKHINRAIAGIEYTDHNSKKSFTISDGDIIVVTSENGDKEEFMCRYFDERHLIVNGVWWNVVEFAYEMEKSNKTVAKKS